MSDFFLPKIFGTTSFRLAGIYILVFLISSLVMGATVFFVARVALQRQMEARIATEAAFLQAEYRDDGLDRLLSLVRLRGRGASALDYLVQDKSGRHLAGEMPSAAAVPTAGWVTLTTPQASEDGGRPERVRALVSDLGDGLLLGVGDDLRGIDAVEESIGTAFAWTVGLMILLGIGGGTLLSRAFLARVDAISRTVEAIIDGDLTRRVQVRGTSDDLDRLAMTLNRMLDRIGVLMESLRQVSTDVAHDLRTPLTRLYQRLEEARSHACSAAEYQVAIDAALRETEGVLETFSALLRIAQVEGASPKLGFSAVDLSMVADAVADAYQLDAEEAGHHLMVEVTPGVVIHGDQELLTQALSNLVENALRHTPAGTRIAVQLTEDAAARPALTVEDNGPGVLPPDLPHLTRRFYRAERSRTTPGNGLGLSLVAAVADLHGAALDLADAKPGLRIRLSFPATALYPIE
ncbi:MAG TPA: ATP-binding protein [Dongiaceae bacterium]|nr:ATP-binding protein [Dongiaceae bacterium]